MDKNAKFCQQGGDQAFISSRNSVDVIFGSPFLFSPLTHVSGGVHDELPLDGAHAVLLVLRVQLVAGDHEGVPMSIEYFII